ncbi:pimeloyl-CoA dehydrogenase small subunit [Erythrobacter arachoides]|uniref:Pimeloyl-CoA dehydrogenase small subunit n=1 Tax=Aurantiacibacter arachoides TaxID=1850444 RepID=A0A845A3C9_9SPHN|nr:acyl-CoA dehydrogenase [Aurantiacibacter arachoides]MXO94130.1 pimeloyl-CoA dehydrogenase small subunit [Aurantiacibacter arachoides]GGD65831.1 acyl-CoA dehydrogenase [Aurantiacibacter arachoides]
MDFSIGEDRQMLADTLRRFLANEADWEKRLKVIETDHGFDRDTWRAMAELGVLGALFSEEAGGFGGTAFDVAAVFGEVGRAIATGPWLATLMAGRLLAAAGEGDPLASVIAGDKVVTWAHLPAHDPESGEEHDVTASPDGEGWTLSGAKGVVDYLSAADLLVVTTGDRAFLVDAGAPGVERAGYRMVDGGSGGELRLSNTPARELSGVGADAIAAAEAMGVVALAWEGVSVMDQLRDQTLDYMRTRKQFGVPIGKFQALQHRMATLALEIEQARSAAINVAARFDSGERDKNAAAAKYTLARVGSLAAEEAIQIHGGIGMTWELPLSHYAKRMVMLGHVLGDEDEHLARYIELMQAA